MKKILASLLIVVILATVGISLVSCSTPQYTAAAEFYYSSDGGHTYGNMTKEYTVGTSVYMRVIVKVVNADASSTAKDNIGVRLTIPNATGYDGSYLDGQIVTPQHDTVQNVTSYDFTVTAASAEFAEELTFTFCFTPNEVSDATMTLVFDDNVDVKYDRQNTIKFVASKSE